MENKSTHTTHPMIIVAATTVTIASLAAIASFAGWIPGNSTPAPVAQVAEVPAVATPAVVPAPVVVPAVAVLAPSAPVPAEKKPVVRKPAPQKVVKESISTREPLPKSNRNVIPVENYPENDTGGYVENARQQPVYAQNNPNANSCRDCATVESVREIKQDGEGTGLGAISGGVVGGLLGNQIGGGRGKTVGAIVGAVGGAYAGNAVEKNVRSTKSYEITVRLDDGNTRVFSEAQEPSMQRGDRVRISNGQLIRM